MLPRITTTAMLLAGVACHSSSAPRTGSLDVTVVAPTGVTGSVTVTGPAGYSKPVSATTTLTGLAPGSYTVTAAAVTSADPIVGVLEMAAVSGSPVTVTSGKAAEAATVTYTPRVGSGGLWTSNFDAGVITEFSAAQLAAGTSGAATTTIWAGASDLTGIAFDANGNLWVAKYNTDTIVEYPAAKLGASGTPPPGVVLAAGGIARPTGLAFDENGNLWVVDFLNNTVSEFTTSQLTSSGSPVPAVVINIAIPGASGASINEAFDANGNLWVVAAGALAEFVPSQLTASGSPVPTIVIGDDGANSLTTPMAMAIDAAGGIWVSNGFSQPFSVVGYSASQLTASGSPVPAVTITPNSLSLSAPAGMAFDASGDLWVANLESTSPIVEFSASQLESSGSPVPAIKVTSSSLSRVWGLAFSPHASALPIKP